jgi:hypothetical protein
VWRVAPALLRRELRRHPLESLALRRLRPRVQLRLCLCDARRLAGVRVLGAALDVLGIDAELFGFDAPLLV